MEDDFMIICLIGILGFFLGFMIGIASGEPNELENGCITYDHKIYCEASD